MNGGHIKEELLERGATALAAALDQAVLNLTGPLITPEDINRIQRDIGVTTDAFEDLFEDREGFEHEVLSYMIRNSARSGSMATAADTYDKGFGKFPSQAMEHGPRASFRAGRDDASFRLLLQLVVAGMNRGDLRDRCRDWLHEHDKEWRDAPLVDSFALFQLELLPPFTADEVPEMFQMLLMGALLCELISPDRGREDLLPRAVQALFLGFTRTQGDHASLRSRLDDIEARWPFPPETDISQDCP
jgi:hypothetical protein